MEDVEATVAQIRALQKAGADIVRVSVPTLAEAEAFGKNSGLGLSISRQIITAHGGMIWAENRKDAEGKVIGARFVVTLPAADA